jgi:hypothetical protein
MLDRTLTRTPRQARLLTRDNVGVDRRTSTSASNIGGPGTVLLEQPFRLLLRHFAGSLFDEWLKDSRCQLARAPQLQPIARHGRTQDRA